MRSPYAPVPLISLKGAFTVRNKNSTSGIVFLVLGAVLLLGQMVPDGVWSGIRPFWSPVADFFDSSFFWRLLLSVLGVLWLMGAVRKRRNIQAGFALVFVLTSLRTLFCLEWIPFWPFVPAVALVITGGALLCGVADCGKAR